MGGWDGWGEKGEKGTKVRKKAKKRNYPSILFNTGLYTEVSIGLHCMLGARFRLCTRGVEAFLKKTAIAYT